jgi:diguanylate cyclase (GGDEF)-like protein
MIELGEGQILGSIWVDQPVDGMRPKLTSFQVLEYFANQVAVAIESARLYSAVRRQVEELNALRATANDISTERDLPILLDAILQRAVKLLQAVGGELGLYDQNENDLRVAVSYNMGQDTTDVRIALGEGAMGRVALAQEPLIIHDYARWEDRLPTYNSSAWHAAIAAPLLIGGRLLGVLGVVQDNPQKRFDASDERLISLFAQQAAIAIENARFYQNVQQAAQRREVLHQASQEIVAVSFESERIYTAIHQATARLMPSEAFVISLLSQDKQRIQAVYAIDLGRRIQPAAISMGDGLSSRVIATGQSIYVEDLQMESIQLSNMPHFGSPTAVRSVLAVPMRLGKNIIGMLSTQSYHPKAFTDEDQNLLEMLASYAAIALENARLFHEVQQLAITDPLTQVFNRRHLFDLGQREFSRARRFHRPLSVIMLDIDFFKQLNDTYGHATGDAALQMLTQRILGIIRDVDVLGRYGGEEFVVILSETELGAAMVVAERIQKQVSETPFVCGRNEIWVTISVGVAMIGKKTRDLNELIERADTAMYRAKRTGRNRVESQ